ncbi:hypothetical protein DFP73DRAFT_592027 [Morchella snyderi]|nr:hypothetical protein DFP73DRAFT_592027 [Morchella snyderi]
MQQITPTTVAPKIPYKYPDLPPPPRISSKQKHLVFFRITTRSNISQPLLFVKMAPPRRNGYAANYDLKSRQPVIFQPSINPITIIPSRSARVDLPRQIPRDPRYSESDEDFDYKGYFPNSRTNKKRYLQDPKAPAPSGYDPLNQSKAFFGSSDGSQTIVAPFNDGSTTSSNPVNNMPGPTASGFKPHFTSKSNHPIPNHGMHPAHETPRSEIKNQSTNHKQDPSVITPQRHRNLNTYNAAGARVPAGNRAAPYRARPITQVVRPAARAIIGRATSSNGSMSTYPQHVKARLREDMREFESERGGGYNEVGIMLPHLIKVPVLTPEQFALGLKALENTKEDFPQIQVEIPSSMPTLYAFDNGLSSNGDNRSIYSSYTPPGAPHSANKIPHHHQNVPQSGSVPSSIISGYLPGYQAPPSSELSARHSVHSGSVTSSAYRRNIDPYAPPASLASSIRSARSESRLASVHSPGFQGHQAGPTSGYSAGFKLYRERSISPNRENHSRAVSSATASRPPLRSDTSRSPSVHSVAGRRSISPDAHPIQLPHRYRTRSNSHAAHVAALAAEAEEQAVRTLTGPNANLAVGDGLGDSDSDLSDFGDSEIEDDCYEESPHVNNRLFGRRDGLRRRH